jgi:YcaO-like protein with predicted kinase domain
MTGPDQGDALLAGPEAPKGYRGGTHRLIPPEETLESVQRFFPVMGITRVGDITGLDVIGIPVVTVCRPNSRSVTVSLGKGLDLTAAKTSAVMESIETFMAERMINPLILGSVNDLRLSHPLVDVDRLPRVAGSLYHRDHPILWIEGQELCTGEPRWVPYEMVHTAYTLPAPAGTGCFVATSNGLASGNHLLEAISHAICETVERDATTLHNVYTADERTRRRIDPQTVDDADCGAALDRLSQAGMRATIWNITSDISIPAFKCLIAEERNCPVQLMDGAEGMGCHPSRGVALLRALTEAAQARLAMISGVRDEPPDGSAELDPARAPAPEADPGTGATGDFSAVPTFESDSFDADVSWELTALRSVGISELIAVNLTRAEFGIPVVRVIVPGLEGPTETVPSCLLGQRAMSLRTGR